MNADEICKLTKIPKGRIYTLLNELLEKKLIEKIDKNPATYSAGNFNEKAMLFLDRQFQNNQMREKEMIHLLDHTREGRIGLVDTSQKYKENIFKMLKESKSMNVILREGTGPFIFYPREKEDYFKIREAISRVRTTFTGTSGASYMFHEKYHELSHSVRIRSIADAKSMLNFLDIAKSCFGELKFERYVKLKLEHVREHQMGLRVVEEGFPYSLYEGDKIAMIVFVYKQSIVGVTTTSKQIIEIYRDIFDKCYSRAVPIQEFIKAKYGITEAE
jgi:hypothetical protein